MNDTMNPWPQMPPQQVENLHPKSSQVRIIPAGQESPPIFSPPAEAALPVPRDDKGRFLAGNSGGGRKPGSRNKFTEQFMQTIAEDFSENGTAVLAALRAASPESYMRIVISLLPKAAIERWEQSRGIDYDNVTEQEFMELLNQLQREKFMHQAVEAVSK